MRHAGSAGDDVPGGDPVCWIHLVCDACGALLERESDPHRPGCEAVRESAGVTIDPKDLPIISS